MALKRTHHCSGKRTGPSTRAAGRGYARTLSGFACSLLAGLGATITGWPSLPVHTRRPNDDHCADGRAGPCADGTCEHQVQLSLVLRDLHDEVGSSLAGVTAQLELTWRLMRSDTDRAARMINEMHLVTTDLLASVRRLSVRQRQHCGGGSLRLRRPSPPDRAATFAHALERMIGRMRSVVRDDLEITLELGDGLEDVPNAVGWAAYWIVNEAFTNVFRHSYANRCLVSVWVSDTDLHIRVEDDGVGVDATARTREARHVGGSGIGNMADRAAELGGWCTVQPAIPTGVVALAALPLAGARSSRGQVDTTGQGRHGQAGGLRGARRSSAD